MRPVRQPWQSPHLNPEGDQLETSWRNLITDWDIPPAVTSPLVATEAALALKHTKPEQIPEWRLTTQFLANGHLANEKTGLERVRALA